MKIKICPLKTWIARPHYKIVKIIPAKMAPILNILFTPVMLIHTRRSGLCHCRDRNFLFLSAETLLSTAESARLCEWAFNDIFSTSYFFSTSSSSSSEEWVLCWRNIIIAKAIKQQLVVALKRLAEGNHSLKAIADEMTWGFMCLAYSLTR